VTPSYFEDVKSYVGFGAAETALLCELLPLAEPHFERIAEHFYDRILRHPNAHAAITGGSDQVDRLKRTLVLWMRSGLQGPHDEAFFERRARIGRMHVRIDLPQRYMFTAINVMRLDFRRVVELVHFDRLEQQRRTNDAIDKLFDLELAIMLHTYQEDSEERLRQRERLATIGQIAAGIGHDLRNPLSVIDSSLYLLRRRVGEDERVVHHLSKIDDQVQHCGRIIESLLGMIRERPALREPIQARALLEHAAGLVHLPATLPIQVTAPDDLTLAVEAPLIHQALANLLANAADAVGSGHGMIQLEARRGDGEAIIEVRDQGPGFDPEILPRAFEPLVTSRSSGTGLGLALVRSIVHRHGGSVAAENLPEGGAVVRLRFPQVSQ
jgi:signal transduction histidine kinase